MLKQSATGLSRPPRLWISSLWVVFALLVWYVDTAYSADNPTMTSLQGRLVVRIYLDGRQDRTEIDAHLQTLDLFEEAPLAGYLTALLSSDEIERLRALHLRLEIDVERTARLRAERAQVQQAGQGGRAQQTGIPGYSCYRTVEETYHDLTQLTVKHPNLVSWIDIGDSWEKAHPGGAPGYDLVAFVLTNRQRSGPKPKFILMAAIHAREYSTAELATRFVEDLVQRYGVDPDVTWLLDYFELHVLPQANPDGRKIAESGELWRKNTNALSGCPIASLIGVDLNRNSSFKWGLPGASSNVCDPTYRGATARSEPETDSIERYIAALYPNRQPPQAGAPAPSDSDGLFISLHSYSELILFPWGWTGAPAPNVVQLETLGRKFGYFNGYQVCNGSQCLYSVSGATDDYTYGNFGLASYTFELGRTFFESCSFFDTDIRPKNMAALYYAFKSARRPYQTPAGPEVLNAIATPEIVIAGQPVKLTATLDDTRYNSNGWGSEPTQVITAAHYTLDAPSWLARSTPFSLTASDGFFDSKIEAVSAVIDSSGWSTGRHIVFIEGQDAGGAWGAPSAAFINIAAAQVGVSLSADEALRLVTAGQTYSYTLQVRNIGIVSDSYRIEVNSAWPVTAPLSLGALAPLATTQIPLTVTVPLTVTSDEGAIIDVRAFSYNDPTVVSNVQVVALQEKRDTWMPWIEYE